MILLISCTGELINNVTQEPIEIVLPELEGAEKSFSTGGEILMCEERLLEHSTDIFKGPGPSSNTKWMVTLESTNNLWIKVLISSSFANEVVITDSFTLTTGNTNFPNNGQYLVTQKDSISEDSSTYVIDQLRETYLGDYNNNSVLENFSLDNCVQWTNVGDTLKVVKIN